MSRKLKLSAPAREIWFRVLPSGEWTQARGRIAQTLELLILVGDAGVTSGEASPLGWARRTSHYIMMLRRAGVSISTTRELAADGVWIARYRLCSELKTFEPSVEAACFSKEVAEAF
jgi:hypothetical protein